MLFRRFAVAIGLLVAALASQLPEYTQQYRQRLGGAIDELGAILSRFDAEVADQHLTRGQGVARLKANGDVLAQERGTALDETASRYDRLRRQSEAFETAGPLSRYVVLAEDFDPGIAKRAYAVFEPAVPVTVAGLVAALIGFLTGYLSLHGLARPFRREGGRILPGQEALHGQPR